MRKNNLFLLLLMALIVMSCSKDETTMSIPQESNAIEFGTYVGRDAQTRATVIDATALQGTGFGVFAYYTSDVDYGSTSTPNFMYNQLVTYSESESESKWEYSPVKYWPNNVDDKVSFFAYAPHSTTANSNVSDLSANTAEGDPTLKFTVNGTATEQVDLLYADATQNLKNRIKNGTVTTGNIGINEKITFKFKHALARIGFNVEAMVDQVNGNGTGGTDSDATTGAIADDTKIVVTKVELIGKFYASGALNLNNTEANVPLWVDVAGTEDRIFKLEAGLTGTNVNFESQENIGTSGNETLGQLVTSDKAKQKLNNDASYLMVIPQNFSTVDPAVEGATNSQIKIRVTYDVITADDKLETGQSKVTNVITSSPFDFNFEHGKAYTFNLHLGMTSVKFSAEVAEWVTKDGENDLETVVNVPINTN